MARQVLPIVGAVIGSYFGQPQLGYAIGSLIGNAVDPLEISGNKVGDNPTQTAAEGGARAIVFGKGCVRATCVIARGNRQVRKTEDQAGKGSGPVTINERVTWTYAIGLGEAIPGGAILRIWENEKLVYDVTPGSQIDDESLAYAEKFRFYDGSEDQLPDPDLETIFGFGNTPYFRGTAYVVFPNRDLTDYQETIPTCRWEVAQAQETNRVNALLLADNLSYGTGFPSPDGIDWSATHYPNGTIPASANKLLAGTDRIIAYSQATVPSIISWSSDQGLTWTPSTFPASTVRGRGLFTIDPTLDVGVYYIPTDSGVLRSMDGGQNFTMLSSPPTQPKCLLGNGLFVVLVGHVDLSFFVLSGSTFVEAGPIGLSGAGQFHWATDGTNYQYGGRGVSTSQPAIFQTTNAYSSVELSIPPSVSSTTISGMAYGVLPNGQRVWLAGTDAGEIYRNINNSGWELAPFTVVGSVLEMAFNGTSFTIASSGLSAYLSRIYVTDGTTLEQRTEFPDGWRALSLGLYAENDTVTSQPIQLADVVAALHLRAGHNQTQFDVAELTDQLAGVVFESTVTAAQAINSLLPAYFADPAEYDKKIRYIKRGKPVLKTLTFDDLVDEPEQSVRENAIEYPRKLHFFFQSSVSGYAMTKATSSRGSPDVRVVGEGSVSAPVTFDDVDEPAQIVAKLHKVLWTDAEGEIEWVVTDEHLDLVETDVVGLSLRGVLRRARITGIESDPGQRKLTMRIDRQSAYVSEVTGIPLPPPTPPQPSIIAPTVNAFLDIPALTDDADDLHYLDAMSGSNETWTGAVLQRSLDAGANYTNAAAAPVNAKMGILHAVVNDASPHYTDTTNRVRVQLYTDDTLDSLTQQQFLSEQGAFALSWEDSGTTRWEILQYRDADDLGDGLYELSHLQRGRLNTGTAEHPIGAKFVLLNSAVRKVAGQVAWIDADLTHRAISYGLSPESAAPQTDTWTALSQTEWPVANVLLSHVAEDLDVSIVPRNRFGTDMTPVRSVNWTGYRITATDGSNTTTVDSLVADYTFDVTGWASPITVSVAQLNRYTGAGPVVTEEIT